MRRLASGMACALLAWQSVAAQTPLSRVAGPAIELRPGLVITQSARVVRRAYRLRANPSVDSALIVIRGDNITVDFNWKPRLFSVVEHESLVDWMSFHHNEQREWLRFGAGIYL